MTGPSHHVDAARVWAEHASTLRFDAIPGDVVAIIKRDVLDMLGTISAGGIVAAAQHVVDHASELGGPAQSTVFGQGRRLPAPHAAMANGALAHALDFDDVYDAPSVHVGVAVVPVAFAVAERVGGVSGEELIAAITLGAEMICRMSEAPLDGARGHWTSQTWGYIGAALTAARLLQLTPDATVDALGLAYGQAAGARQFIADRSAHRSIYGGFAAHGAVTAALLAARGVTGAQSSLDGEYGFFSVYHSGRYDRTPLVTGLGSDYRVRELSFKLYPSCRNTHPYVDATLKAVEMHGIEPAEIDQIVVHVAGFAKHLCEPRDVCIDPQLPGQAQYSIPYVVALAAVSRQVTLDDFFTCRFRDPDVLDMARRVISVDDPSLGSAGLEAGIVEIHCRSGVYVERVDYATGNPASPMQPSEFERKFRDCLRYARRQPEPEAIDRALQHIDGLEHLQDIAALTRLL
jgi:2-methylcitrate dehydratase PrpD